MEKSNFLLKCTFFYYTPRQTTVFIKKKKLLTSFFKLENLNIKDTFFIYLKNFECWNYKNIEEKVIR